MGQTKVCTKCGEEKDLKEFHSDSQKSTGRYSSCRKCCSKDRAGYRSPNKIKNQRKYEKTTRRDFYRKNPILYLWDIAKKRAKKQGKEFSIVPEDIIFTGYCPVTGVKLDVITNKMKNSVSLDRVDNSKGYIPGNVVAISRWANLKKNDMTIQDLENIIKYIKEYTE